MCVCFVGSICIFEKEGEKLSTSNVKQQRLKCVCSVKCLILCSESEPGTGKLQSATTSTVLCSADPAVCIKDSVYVSVCVCEKRSSTKVGKSENLHSLFGSSKVFVCVCMCT